MTAPAGFATGFAFSALAADERTRFVVNICGHESVGMPLARSMDVVSEGFIEANGIDNLVVPISVSTPKKGGPNSQADYVVDVVVHPCLVRRCVPTHRLSEHMLAKLTQLALEWVLSECGVRLVGKSCTLLGVPLYVRAAPTVELNEVYKLAEQLLSQQRAAKNAAQDGNEAVHATEDGVRLPEELTLSSQATATTSAATSSAAASNEQMNAKSKPLIQEMGEPRGIRKGFLVDRKATLYGPQGTSEGSGKAPDPLGHIPQSLRDKCTIIDTRNMSTTAPRVPDAATSTENSNSAALAGHQQQRSADAATGGEVVAERTSAANGETASWELLEMAVASEAITLRLRPCKPVHSMREVDLSVTECAVEVDGLNVALPKPVVTDGVKARFVKATNILTITCPRAK